MCKSLISRKNQTYNVKVGLTCDFRRICEARLQIFCISLARVPTIYYLCSGLIGTTASPQPSDPSPSPPRGRTRPLLNLPEGRLAAAKNTPPKGEASPHPSPKGKGVLLPGGDGGGSFNFQFSTFNFQLQCSTISYSYSLASLWEL